MVAVSSLIALLNPSASPFRYPTVSESGSSGSSFTHLRVWFFLAFILAILVAAVATRNDELVQLDLIFLQTEVSLRLVILGSFVTGLAASLLATLAPRKRDRRQNPAASGLLLLLLAPVFIVSALALLSVWP